MVARSVERWFCVLMVVLKIVIVFLIERQTRESVLVATN